MSAGALFVAGAHTDIGKTHVGCALIRAARARGRSCDAFKPVLSGFDPAQAELSDAGRLLDALGRPVTEIDAVSPLRFSAPLAPPLAARREGCRLALADLLARCRAWLAGSDAQLKLLEGAGGVMSPIAEDGLALDLPAGLALPSVLVAGSYLGAVSHTLTALEVMQRRGLTVLAVVVSQDADADAPGLAETCDLVRGFAGPAPLVAAPRGAEAGWPDAVLDLVSPALWPGAAR
ncbi:MAG: dethiobiotin synthase [Phenylobacterium sp.]